MGDAIGAMLTSVALVALAQAAGIGPSMPNPGGTRSDMNGDFRSQGCANLLGGLFQALPSGGSMSRTGVAVSAGARTRCAGVISGVFPDTRLTVAGPKDALVATLLKPASAPPLVQAGKITLDGDETVLHTLAGLLDDFDPDFPVVTP
ncbi:alkyl sulfatase C-terminal domain-containing protein [Streptomyces tendae]|uniref:alkyl sulfatase C-terminal domain-containing protein n=1 Tax=Streptomyces tendae TaxID=1932 RepID=UPI00379FA251